MKLVKHALLILLLAFAFEGAAADKVLALFTAQGANGTVTTPAGKFACVAIWAPSAATATVTISVQQGGAVVPIPNPYINPTTGGKIFCGPTQGSVTVAVTGWSAGTVSSTISMDLK